MGTRKLGRARGRGRIVLVVLVACLAVVAGVLLVQARQYGAADGPLTAGAAAGTGATGAAATSASTGSSTARPDPGPSTRSAKPRSSATESVRPSGTAARSTAAAQAVPASGKRTLTLVNRLSQTIWPAIAADPTHPVAATGWVLAPGASLSFPIPDHWDVRVWARTGCSFDAAGNGHCVTGDCAGHFQCGRTWGQFPSTLAEFNLNAWNGMDFYDVSLVEGNNLPMWINNSGGRGADPIDARGCAASGCTRDANALCPKAMQRTHDGAVVACLSACLVLGTDQACCTGAYAARSACVPSTWPIDSAAVFKKAEPFAYSYVDDDATSVLTCSGECDYRITWGVSPPG
ncbi:thaumatin family protein [Streptacidiphilus cavernicola]|uniref:Thaumatin family protein n=1 Tax=Streptacidiphilus cavernicola TaxID=3342716 RepID=A0ABV6VWD4_9ACTN